MGYLHRAVCVHFTSLCRDKVSKMVWYEGLCAGRQFQHDVTGASILMLDDGARTMPDRVPEILWNGHEEGMVLRVICV